MSKASRILLFVVLSIAGWFMAAIGFTIKNGPVVNTTLFLLGFIIFLGGIIGIIVTAAKKK